MPAVLRQGGSAEATERLDSILTFTGRMGNERGYCDFFPISDQSTLDIDIRIFAPSHAKREARR